MSYLEKDSSNNEQRFPEVLRTDKTLQRKKAFIAKKINIVVLLSNLGHHLNKFNQIASTAHTLTRNIRYPDVSMKKHFFLVIEKFLV